MYYLNLLRAQLVNRGEDIKYYSMIVIMLNEDPPEDPIKLEYVQNQGNKKGVSPNLNQMMLKIKP